MLLLAVMLSVLMGVTLGLLGGGGSILAVPILIFVVGFEAKAAIAGSLLIVGITSAASLVEHARNANVRWHIGFLFGAVAMVGSYAGGRAAAFIPDTVLLLLFAAMMAATGAAMLRPAAAEVIAEPPIVRTRFPFVMITLEGLVVGSFTGMVGAGGGFLVVPALVLLSGLPMCAAVGTSLLVIAMKSAAGFAAYATHVALDFGQIAPLVVAAVVGALVGSHFTRMIPPARLRAWFAWFVVAMAVFLVYQRAPFSPIGRATSAAAVALAVFAYHLYANRPVRKLNAES